MFGRVTRRAASPVIALLTVLTIFAPFGTPAAAQQPAPTEGTQAQVTGTPLTPGTTAQVRTLDGSCLRLRANPGLSADRLTCVPDGLTVLVMPATQEADGYRWQLVEWRGQSGWAADEFLRTYTGPPITDSCQASTISPGITGQVPSNGGFGLVVWGGGTIAGLETTALAEDCVLTAVWASRPDGGFVSYNFSVPDFVNDEWRNILPEIMDAGTPLLIVCDPPGAAITTRALPLPAATGAAPIQTGSAPAPTFDARAAVVIDEASGQVLYEYNAHTPMPQASLTKIATAILALEGAPVDNWVPVNDVDYRQMPGSSVMGVIPGDCFRLRDLVYGLMLPSGNDAALAIARYQAGSDEAFVHEMNTLMDRLGLTETNFTDPHGLGSELHHSSAYDIAMMSRYAMTQIPLFRTIVDTTSWQTGGQRRITMRNVNSFLTQIEGADGVKTGYTEEAGRTLSASATRNGHRLYAVILNDNNRYATAGALIDWAFENYTWQ
ncbi:MAG: D-alanyl-D-alanine carboxypeptidase [Dehalococcoidia bacterium]|nr:D-alanyl-D-alanine carboxypeptidase [Dehalococcoidia bacterium]